MTDQEAIQVVKKLKRPSMEPQEREALERLIAIVERRLYGV